MYCIVSFHYIIYIIAWWVATTIYFYIIPCRVPKFYKKVWNVNALSNLDLTFKSHKIYIVFIYPYTCPNNAFLWHHIFYNFLEIKYVFNVLMFWRLEKWRYSVFDLNTRIALNFARYIIYIKFYRNRYGRNYYVILNKCSTL